MDYVIGIDSGGTNFRVRAEGLDGTLLGQYLGEYVSHYALSEDEVRKRIDHHIDACLSTFSGEIENCKCLVCGTSGFDSEEDGKILTGLYCGIKRLNCPVIVINDAELAHYTVTGGAGILVLSGTGSIAFGVNRKGESRRVGGWPFTIMGEEGSGTWVSRKALRYMADCYDGVAEETLLAAMIKEKLGFVTVKEMLNYIATLTMSTHDQICLAELVDAAAEQGDENALRIFREAADESFRMVDNLVRLLGMENDPEIVVGVWGSNIVQSRVHFERFREILLAKYPQAQVKMPEMTAVEGAAKMARETLAENTDAASA